MSFDIRNALNSEGNWRFKGLMAAAISPDARRKLAKAWPSGNKGDYRFLSSNQRNDSRLAPNRAYHPEATDVEYASDSRELSAAKSALPESQVRKLDNGEGVHIDKYIRTLLSEDVTELDVLFRETLLDTVIRGAQPYQWARDASTVINVDTRKGDIPRGSDRIYAEPVATGAEIPTNEENYDTVPFNCEKYGLGFGVTDELVDESQVDVIERQVEFTGAAIENAINRVALNELLDNAGNDFDTAGTDQDVSMVLNAQQEIEADNFGEGDRMVMHPEFKASLYDDSNLLRVDYAGTDETLRNREVSSLLGTTNYTASGDTYNGTTETWGFANDGEKGAIVYRSDMHSIQMYQDLTVKEFEDPITDITGGNVRAQFDSNYHQPNAASTIQY